jgi:hypothetical protein
MIVHEVGMRPLLFSLIFFLCAPNACLAWGDSGHKTVAEIATAYLSQKAISQIEDLLEGGLKEFVDVASWADDITGDRPETSPWHVVPIPPDGVRYDRVRDCKNDDCIVEKIKDFSQIVGDQRAVKLKRVEALKFLIHFVGDLHVPLHAHPPVNNSKGTWVRIGEKTNRINCWWDSGWCDTGFEAEFGSTPSEVVKTLIAQITVDQRKEWMKGTSEDWANESFQIAHNFISKYDLIDAVRRDNNTEMTPIVLPDSALEEMKAIAAQRLKMAGVRLAWLLNQALK